MEVFICVQLHSADASVEGVGNGSVVPTLTTQHARVLVVRHASLIRLDSLCLVSSRLSTLLRRPCLWSKLSYSLLKS
jgi:hypothetical protein